MKKNLDNYLKEFLRNKGNLFIEDQYGFYVMYRIRLLPDNRLYVETSDDTISCSLGDFHPFCDNGFILHPFYEVDQVIKCTNSRTTLVNVINRMYPNDIKKRLYQYLRSKSRNL